MNREILFRGKDNGVLNGVWQYGSLDISNPDAPEIAQIDRHNNKMRVPIIIETVGQYTGLTDKHGKKIFEGDVVKWDGTEISQIRYCGGVYRLCNAKGYYGVSLHNHYSYVEVIGNIHDNPELLKGDAE